MKCMPVVLCGIIAVFWGCSSSSSCISIVPPAVNLTGEKTSVERQIVGDYEEIEKDAWAVSSVKTASGSAQSGGGIMVGDQELLSALKIREFHRAKIRLYKDAGAVGEDYNGLLAYRPLEKYEGNKAEKDILFEVIANENGARRTIFIRSLVVQGKEKPGEEDVRIFARAFADEQSHNARKNDWIQEASGKWKRK